MRPDVGTQAQFKKTKAPKTYRYDSSLAPALDFDSKNPAREEGEAAIREVLDAKTLEGAKAAAAKLKGLSKPFLNWAGKAERLSFDVPTLPLFVHERLSTKAILETIKGHRSDKQIDFMDDLFGDPRHSIADQVLKSYEHRDKWVNRMVLGDSLVVMNSLIHYEGLGGQVQMIYMDPPYGVKFGSNFQPFVRAREVKHGDDEDMTREPEVIQAYRDTWELGPHSYLTYLRDRLLLSRELLSESGSMFVQIGDENAHHVRELLDDVFGEENFVSSIVFQKTGGQSPTHLSAIYDTILWYAKDKSLLKFRPAFVLHPNPEPSDPNYIHLELPDGTLRSMTPEERRREVPLPAGAKIFRYGPITSAGAASSDQTFKFDGESFRPQANSHWKTSIDGMKALAAKGRILRSGKGLAYKLYWDDFAAERLSNIWTDTQSGGFNDPQLYVVQTTTKVIQRCLLMATDPGDLVLDPTCGSGTTAYVAESWGRRWMTVDTSRVPLALARQRLLTATFPFYQLRDESRGPAGGLVYKRRQNRKGSEVGGIIPHVTLKSIANNELPDEEVLFDRPEESADVIRISGPFTVEATIPTPLDWEESESASSKTSTATEQGSFVDRMLEVLRKSPVLHLDGRKSVTLKNLRLPAKTLSLSAEGVIVNGKDKPVALVFGPENGAVSEKLIFEAAKEANVKGYATLYVIGFAIQANARVLIEKCESIVGIPAIYIQATPDLMMGDLLKNMRSSQIFSVCGLPEIKVHSKKDGKETLHQVELLGFDVFDPVSMDVGHRGGDDVPAWFLDTNYNDLCFHVSQAFFPRTSAWDNLKKALKSEYSAEVWEHLAGTTSAPFAAGEHQKIAVKVIDDRGNELLVVKDLKAAK
ncbi:MAG: site-specific DNA-methyltransferase [Elusimicrobiota bacterium]|nr:MAG: site-specific DNA-methyltransferase [Elusimicrobiota bacterium]